MQLIHNITDVQLLLEHSIAAEADDAFQGGRLACSCGWKYAYLYVEDDAVHMTHSIGAYVVPPIIVTLQKLADAGRDHIADELHKRDAQ